MSLHISPTSKEHSRRPSPSWDPLAPSTFSTSPGGSDTGWVSRRGPGRGALGWALVDLLTHPAERARVASGDTEVAQRCALESTRMAQRSIMSRAVLTPVDLDTGDVTYRVPPGWTIATLLPLLNTSAAPGLDSWNPDRWHRHRLADHSALPSPMLVTAFGHGRHSCPAQPFSLAAMTTAMTQLHGRYE